MVICLYKINQFNLKKIIWFVVHIDGLLENPIKWCESNLQSSY